MQLTFGVLCPETSLSLFISSNCFLVESLGFSIYEIKFSANINSFTYLDAFYFLFLFLKFIYLLILPNCSA